MKSPMTPQACCLRVRRALLPFLFWLSFLSAHLIAQDALRVYVLRTGDNASDLAVVQALTERGHSVDLGVRANQLDSASIQLSEYHVVVGLGVPAQRVTTTGASMLSKYLNRSGGLVIDGEFLYQLPRDAVTALQLPASHCGTLQHSTPITVMERLAPLDPILHSEIPASIEIPLTTLHDPGQPATRVEHCLAAQPFAKPQFSSKASNESRSRLGVAATEPSDSSRAVTFSVTIRNRELQSSDFSRMFVNSVEWAGARSRPSTQSLGEPPVTPLRLYVLRTGEDSSDQAVVQALTERGHSVDLGVRATQLDSASVRLSDYHGIVALGVPGQRITGTGVDMLVKYLNETGSLVTDGEMLYQLPRDAVTELQLPAGHCGLLENAPSTTAFERIEPTEPTVHAGIPRFFSVPLTTLRDPGQITPRVGHCLSPTGNARLFLYSRGSEDALSLPGVVGNEPGVRRRLISFSTTIRSRELQSLDFRRLFVNAVEWAAINSTPPTPERPQLVSKSLQVYVFRTGDEATDKSVTESLRERGHTFALGVKASQIQSAAALSGFNAVVALGVPGEPISRVGADILSQYLQSSGRLVLDGEMLYQLAGAAVNLRMPAAHCGTIRNADAATSLERVDPADPLVHRNIPSSFPLSLSILRDPGQTVIRVEHCVAPAGGGKIALYSRQRGETNPRAGLLVNEPEVKSRAAVFSVAIRSRELSNPNFRALFVNTVEWAADQIADPVPFAVSPEKLSFLFKTSADSPRSQTLEVTPTTLNPVALTAAAVTSTGGDWLSVTPDQATTPTKFSVRVSPVFLPPGIYQGEVVLTAQGSTVRIPVRVAVNSSAPCTFDVSPIGAAFPAAGATGRIGVSSPPGCNWNVASGSPWITVSSGFSGSGPGTVVYSAAPATALAARSGALTVAGIPFPVSQSGTGLSFRLEPSGLDFRTTEGAAAPDGRVVSIFSTAAGTAFTAAISGGAWLSATPSSGTAPGSIIVSVTPAGLAPGTFRGSVTIRIPNATLPEQTLPVTLTVEAAAPAQLRVEPTSMTLPAVQGGEARADRVQVVNVGRGTLNFRASVQEAPWMSVQPDNGSVAPGSTQTLTVLGDPRGLQPGSYTGHISISTPSGETTDVVVTMAVTAGSHSILLSQTGLSYTAVALGGRVLPQSFGILNIGNGFMDWTVSADTLSGGSWLSVSKTRGSADGAALDIPLIDVGVEAAALRPGEYHGRITISSPTATNSPQIVSVLLQVLPPGSDPGPIVRPTGLIFVTPAGGAAASQEVTVSNPTADMRSYNSNRLTTDNANWFTHTPVQSTVTSTQPTRISVQSSSTGLSSGVRKGVLTLLFGDGAVQNVNILSIVPPSASLTSKGGDREAASCASPKLVISHRTLRQDFIATLGQAVSIEVKAADSCGNLLIPKKGASVAVVATFSNGDARLNLVHIGEGIWTGTWRPAKKVNHVVVAVTAVNAEGVIPNVQAEQVTVSGVIREVGRTPIITAGGLVHGASFAAGVPLAPGSLVTLYGANLADEAASPDKLPLPRELNGTEVLLGDRSLPLLFVSKDQVNVQVPFGLPSNTQHQISVRRGQELSVPETITVAEAVPGIFTKSSSGKGQGLIFEAVSYVLAEAANPAKAGDVIVVFCTGLGVVAPTVESGDPSPSQSPARVPAPVELIIGGKKAQTLFVGLTSNAVGLYQINAIVPEGVTAGNSVSVVITAGGQTSPEVTMAVR